MTTLGGLEQVPLESLSVRHLVELTCQQGDLYSAVDGRATPEEGLLCQRQVQQREPAGYECEIPFDRLFVVLGTRLRVRGRADGRNLSRSPPLLDEVKASRADPIQLETTRGHLHWAQLRLYAGLQALELPACERFELRLRYVHPDTGAEHRSVRSESRDSLLLFLMARLREYGSALATLWRRRRARDAQLATFAFPLSAFRPNQRVLSARTYQTLISGASLLLEASTGMGKSIGVLYPAARAFGPGPAQRYFYLTARRTGALAAVRALQQLNDGGAPVRWVQIQSKARWCQRDGEACIGAECPNALGYFDRIHSALAELEPVLAIDAQTIEQVAQRHQLCPFELSLDIARSADIVIADYNYVFDPDVRLQRFADGNDIGLLIDEAHQLVPRTLAALGATLDQELLRAARQQAGSGPLRKRLDSVRRAFAKAVRAGAETELNLSLIHI